MNSIEKLLLEGLKENPEDWDIRLELVGKLVKSGDSDTAESILTESPVPPPDEDVLLEALQAIPEARASALTGIASDYIALHPSSAPAHYSLAQLYLSTGKKTQALEHYRVALAFDSSLRDKDLAQLMLDSKEDEVLETSETQGKASFSIDQEAIVFCEM